MNINLSLASFAFIASTFSLVACATAPEPAEGTGSTESHIEKSSAPAEEGDVCDSTLENPCEDGFECRGSEGGRFTGNTCQYKPREEGDVCDSTRDDACEDGLICTTGPKGSRFTGTYCQVAPAEEGDVCNDDRPCQTGLECKAAPPTSRFTGMYCQK